MRMFKRLFSPEFLLTPFYIYKLIKLFTWNQRNNILLIALRTLLTITILPIVTLTIVLTVVYYHIVEITLRVKHGRQFYAMLDGCDRIWIMEFSSKSKHLVNATYMISPNAHPNQPEQILETLRRKYTQIAQTHPRYASVIKSFMGLQYFCKLNQDIEHHVMYMDDYNTTEEFFQLLEHYSDRPMGNGDNNLWEIRVGRTLIQWQGGHCYPLFLRNHHALGDGVSIVTLMTTHLVENGVEVMKEKCNIYKSILEKVPKTKTTPIEKLKSFVQKDFSFPTLTYPEKPNVLHREHLSGRKHMVYSCEPLGDDLIQKVKAIKNYHAVAFIDVMGTAISASLYDYYVKYEKAPPNYITSMNPYFLMSSDFNKLVKLQDGGVPITKLGNKFSIGFSRIPIDFDTENNNNNNGNNNDDVVKIKMADGCNLNLSKRLKVVHKENNVLKNALDFAFCYWQMRICCAVPMSIGKYLVTMNDATMCITNLPGNTTSDLVNGCGTISDTIVFANNFNTLGATFTLFTYDDRFRLGLVVDKDLIEERHEAQLITDNIFKYIHCMYDQLPLALASNDAKYIRQP